MYPFSVGWIFGQVRQHTNMRPVSNTLLASMLLLVAIHMHSVRTQAADMDLLREYCDIDNLFNPQCEENEVILIKHARYGRMREGGCIEMGEGNLGCSMDAREVLDRLCSGRQTCEVTVTSIPPRKNPPCHRSLRGYLEAAYECIEVIHPPSGYCLPSDVFDVKQQHGYLSSIVTEETGCGSTENPWWVSGAPGQILQFHLLTFDMGENRKYATLQDTNSKVTKAVYGGTTGRSLAYTSTSSKVKVTLQLAHAQEAGASQFLLEFEVMGCADLPPPQHGWVRRTGLEVEMGCNNTKEHTPLWTLHCEDKQWVGTDKKCVLATASEEVAPTATAAPKIQEFMLKPEHKVLLITIAVGIADVIGFCILLCGIIYICRRWRERRRYLKQGTNTIQRTNKRPADRRSLAKEGVEEEGEYYCPTESDYYGTWQMKHLRKGPSAAQPGPSSPDGNVPPLPPPYTPSCGSSSYYCNSQGDDHVYERPIFLPRQAARGEEGRSRSLKYYELDPNYVDPSQTDSM